MRPGIVMLVGLPGSGKSTLASALAERLPDMRVLDKDVVRHGLFNPCDYTAAERSISFSAMLDAADYHLGRGRTVVIDGVASSPRQAEVEAAQAVAAGHGAFFATVLCDVPVEVAVARCESSAGAHVAANRDGALVRRVAADMDEPPGDYLTVDTTRPVAEAATQTQVYIEEMAQ
jgi:predicted kinase